MVTQDRLRYLFTYRADGRLMWEVPTSRRVRRGDPVGCLNKQGYRIAGVDGESYMVCWLVWIYHYGTMSAGCGIDHINRERSDDRIENLRCVPRSVNLLNSTPMLNSTGFAGVQKTSTGRYRAFVHVARKQTYLGTFDTPTEAHLRHVEEHVKLYGADSRFHPEHVSRK